eukprot:TRINITY_DN27734_c0_g1_i2.p1 TRINITY_DN27734_c0_g1~~TRINITY_DN27734_c0_g1_i2.p1  ORF type:complete len:613 (+),score=82.34 TRINITY_DN27734_c0_g1_i2:113-1951(+)
MDSNSRLLLVTVLALVAAQHVVRSLAFLRSACRYAHRPFEVLWSWLQLDRLCKQGEDAVHKGVADRVHSEAVAYRLRFTTKLCKAIAWYDVSYCAFKAIHFASGASTRTIESWVPYLVGVMTVSIASTLQLRQWQVDVAYILIVISLGFYQWTFFFPEEYFGFAAMTTVACLVAGLTQDYFMKAILGNAVVFAFRLSALDNYLPKPGGARTQADVQTLFADTVSYEIFLMFFVTVIQGLLEYGGKNFLVEQISRAELKVELQCVHNLLAAFCDCVVKLDSNLCIRSDSPKLGAILMTGGNSLRSKHFLSYVAKRDVQRFKDFISKASVDLKSVDGEQGTAAQALHMDLLDSANLPIGVKAFVVPEDGGGHLLGICEVDAGEVENSRVSQVGQADDFAAQEVMARTRSHESHQSHHTHSHHYSDDNLSDAGSCSHVHMEAPKARISGVDVIIHKFASALTVQGYIIYLGEKASYHDLELLNFMDNLEGMAFENWLKAALEKEGGRKPKTSATFRLPYLGRVCSEKVCIDIHEEATDAHPEIIQLRLAKPTIATDTKSVMRERMSRQKHIAKASSRSASPSEHSKNVFKRKAQAEDCFPGVVPAEDGMTIVELP